MPTRRSSTWSMRPTPWRPASSDSPSPMASGSAREVGVDRVGRGLGDGDLDAAGLRVFDLLVAREAHAHAHRRDHLQGGVEGVDGDIEADLVVALAGAAV